MEGCSYSKQSQIGPDMECNTFFQQHCAFSQRLMIMMIVSYHEIRIPELYCGISILFLGAYHNYTERV